LVQTHNKAIRDKIPEIIRATGQNCKIITMSDGDFLLQMERKLSEEVDEYKQSKSPEELADILEVVYRIAELLGVKKEELERMRQEKEVKRGAFSKNLFLIETG
jgi:predicted house-cleaning noncanonical NTP pyrophosphatase (MazG superfamily)